MTDDQQIELPDPSSAVKTTLDNWTPISLPDGSFIVIEGIDGAGKSTVLGALAHGLDEDEFVITTEPDDSTVYGQAVRHAIKDDATHPLSVFFLFLADHANHYLTTVQPALERGEIVICDRYIDSRYAYQSYALEDAVANPDPWLATLESHIASTEYPTVRITDEIADAEPETVFFIALARAFTDTSLLHPALRPGSIERDVLHDLDSTSSPLFQVASQPVEWLRPSQDPTPYPTLRWIQRLQEYENWSRLPDLTVLLDISVDTSLERIGDGPKETFEKREFLEAVRENYLILTTTEPRFSTIDAELAPPTVVDRILDALTDTLNE